MESRQTPARLVPFEDLDFVPRFEHGEMAQLAEVSGTKDSIWLPKGTALTYEAEDALITYAIHPADWQDPAS